MQDIHSMGGSGRLFGGGGGIGGGGDRRLRTNHQQSHQAALKCPRCDSINTKFCYYNNYNLSQPRHFCKNCRRYWTKGGVLRNVPVGGGCRKAKRSKSKQSSSGSSAIAAEPTRSQEKTDGKVNSNSSSESSTLTATIAASTTAATEVASANSSGSISNLLSSISNSKFYNDGNTTTNVGFDIPLPDHGSDCGIFPEMGSFTSLITSTNETLSFGFSNLMNHDQSMEEQVQVQVHHNQQWQHPKTVSLGEEQQITGGLIDQTVQVDPLSGRSNNGGFGPLDWQGVGGDHHGLFDLPDHGYWSQSQWTDQDQPSLYLP